MGAAIIAAIQSGLGLISTLATQFLDAFEALFWDSTNSALTSFATFGLVMLGIGVCFSVVSLVYNLIRGNTGVN